MFLWVWKLFIFWYIGPWELAIATQPLLSFFFFFFPLPGLILTHDMGQSDPWDRVMFQILFVDLNLIILVFVCWAFRSHLFYNPVICWRCVPGNSASLPLRLVLLIFITTVCVCVFARWSTRLSKKNSFYLHVGSVLGSSTQPMHVYSCTNSSSIVVFTSQLLHMCVVVVAPPQIAQPEALGSTALLELMIKQWLLVAVSIGHGVELMLLALKGYQYNI